MKLTATSDLLGGADEAIKEEVALKAEKSQMPASLLDQFWAGFDQLELTVKPMMVKNEQRRWEIVSAIQKTIRRGETQMALRYATAMLNHPDPAFQNHLWRRLVVIAMEDIGFGESDLMILTSVMYDVFTRKAFLEAGKGVAYYLIHLMSEAHCKDRSICDMAVVDYLLAEMGKEAGEYWLTENALSFVHVCQHRDDYNALMEGHHQTLASIAWKTQDMSKVYAATLDYATKTVGEEGDPGFTVEVRDEYPPAPMIKGLPSYAYDMHTRTGKYAIRLFVASNEVKALLEQVKAKKPKEAVEWCVFYAEAECLNKRLIYTGREALYKASVEMAMEFFGVPDDQRETLITGVRNLIPILNKCREKATHSY